MTRKLVVFLVLCLLIPLGAFAQGADPGAPPPTVRMRMGPLFLNPTLALTNAGVDTNVFNVSDAQGPQQDFTVTVTPATDLWLRLGRTWLDGTINEDVVWYQKFADQRSVNDTYKVSWVVPLNRLTFTPGASYVNTRARPGYEIDARVQQFIADYNATLDIQALSKTYFGVRVDRQANNFAADAVFRDVDLQDALTRTATTAALTARHQLTPLTSLTLDVSREQDRFPSTPARDADSTMVTGGVKFDKFALIQGGATFGYEDYKPQSSAVPGYRGSTAGVDLAYAAFGTTKLALNVTRNVQYSYDVTQPYYVLTGVSGSISQEIFGPVDLEARGGVQNLAYRDQVGVPVAVPNRLDAIHTYGGGIGYHLGRDMRLGFNLDQERRISAVPGDSYSGLKFGVAATYGS